MATLTDEQFLSEFAQMVDGKPSELVKTDPPPAAAAVPVVEPPPAADAPVVEAAPVVEPPPAVEPPVVEPAVAAAAPLETPAITEPAAVTPPAVEPPPVDYKAIHDRLFGAKIRAGGQDIQLENVDEVISLVQKGVGFHSKMNAVQKDVKIGEMLRNNGLFDEGKLSLLIDAHAGKPGAIKKLLDSAKIDPLSLDSAEASTYAPSDHSVPDEQVRFKSQVDDLNETKHGQEILQDAAKWDQASRAEIYKTPELLGILTNHKDLGRYDLIKNQVERQRILGHVPANESFLQSYNRVGQQMMQAGAFGVQTPASTPTPTPVAQKVIAPAAPANAARAAAAASTRTSTPAARPVVDTAAMSDEAFSKYVRSTYKI